MPRKKKPCKVCGKPFEPKSKFQNTCSNNCSYEAIMRSKEKNTGLKQ